MRASSLMLYHPGPRRLFQKCNKARPGSFFIMTLPAQCLARVIPLMKTRWKYILRSARELRNKSASGLGSLQRSSLLGLAKLDKINESRTIWLVSQDLTNHTHGRNRKKLDFFVISCNHNIWIANSRRKQSIQTTDVFHDKIFVIHLCPRFFYPSRRT